MNNVGTAHAQAEVKHRLANTVFESSSSYQAISHNVDGRFIGNQQTTSKEIGLCLNTTVMDPLSMFIERRHVLVPQKEMGEFVANIATLAEWMVGIIVHDCRFETTHDGQRRKAALVCPSKRGTVAPEFRHSNHVNVERGAHCLWVDGCDGRHVHALANT